VRIKSLLKKAGADGKTVAQFVIKDEDRKLALLLTELPDYFAAALRDYAPHVLCDYAFKLAQEFSSFYGSCHIISEPDQALARQPPGALQPDFPPVGAGPGASGHPNPRKNVNSCQVLKAIRFWLLSANAWNGCDPDHARNIAQRLRG
jgi:hypothetical protein